MKPSAKIDPLHQLDRSTAGARRFFESITRFLPGYAISTIVDVGANVGQTCIPYAASLPEARIIACEPVPSTFDELTRNIAGFGNIAAVNVALGHRNGSAVMSAHETAVTNKVLAPGEGAGADGVTVPLKTGAQLCEDMGIDHLSLLKIDAEGYDMKVIDGFIPCLDKVDFIKVEAGMNDYNTTHIPFLDFYITLSRRGFLLFHIYDQRMEWKMGGRPALRRANPMFINARLADIGGIT